jgi:hypothetical protein
MSKKCALAIIFVVNVSVVYSQSFVKKEFSSNERRGITLEDDIQTDSNRTYYKIKFINDSSDFGSMHYPISYCIHNKLDTLSLIQELLHFEGDTDLCVLDIRCYNPSISQVYYGEEKNYSIQVEALFIINQFYFKEPFFFSPYPIIMSTSNYSMESIKGENIELAYKAYKQWFNKLKEIGIKKARIQNLRPFDGYPLEWYQFVK